MSIPSGIIDNLRFLWLEIDAQLEALQGVVSDPNARAANRILDRNGYALNLKLRIQHDCLARLAASTLADSEATELRTIEFAANELDRIAELCRDSVRRINRIADYACFDHRSCWAMLNRVRRGVALIESALKEKDTRTVLKLGRIESKLDDDYDALTASYLGTIKTGGGAEDVLRALFVAHYIEQMGDALLDISEVILSRNLGQPLSLERYRSLQASVETLDNGAATSELQIEKVADTRSGSAVSRLETTNAKGDVVPMIFKAGVKRKLKEERQGVESWHEIYPGLAPKILAFNKQGRSASLLIEHLPGITFEKILLHESADMMQTALGRITETLRSIWRETRTDTADSAGYMGQLRHRLDEVYRIHPRFRHGAEGICGHRVRSFEDLIADAARREADLPAPFSVYIHGDFNVDNILYDPDDGNINFIDLHRSRHTDYVQDVSVFMVSSYRLQVLDALTRARILQVAEDIYGSARGFAQDSGDTTFDMRLALGLARSFASSTRFILDKSLAQGMFLRARLLLEKVLATPGQQAEKFRTPVAEVFSG
jgi:aminoglycoside phosphotransferase (APT) family kinase protein/phosphate uptake regulator